MVGPSEHDSPGKHSRFVPILAMTLAAGCGGDEVVDPSRSEILWTFGEAGRHIVSIPVADDEGNMVVVSHCAECGETDTTVTSVAPDGHPRWSRTLPGRLDVKRGANPAVGPGGDVWVCITPYHTPYSDDALVRLSPDGTVRWSVVDGCSSPEFGVPDVYPPSRGIAIGPDGHAYVIAGSEVLSPDSAPARAPELRAYDPGGNLLWSRIIGVGNHELSGEPYSYDDATLIGGLVLDAAGRLVVGCDTCSDPPSPGIARVDAATGEPRAFVPLPGEFREHPDFVMKYAWYTIPVVEADHAWIGVDGTIFRTDWSSVVESHDDFVGVPLVSDGGSVVRLSDESAATDTGDATLHLWWDEEERPFEGLTIEGGGVAAATAPVAVAANGRVVMVAATPDPAEAEGMSSSHEILQGYLYPPRCDRLHGEQARCHIYVLDREQGRLWAIEDASLASGIPYVADGTIVYVDRGGDLVAREAPVDGFASGPHVSVLGDAHGDHSL